MWDPGGSEVGELLVTSDDLGSAGSRVADSIVCSNCCEEDSARECYVRLLLQEKEYTYIDERLIYVGISDTQVTNYCFQNPSVELPEGYLLLKKYGANRLQNIWVYDAWWRLLRNMNIKNPGQLLQYEPEHWPAAIITLLLHLNRIPSFMLKAGIFSKTAMAISYLFNQSKATR